MFTLIFVTFASLLGRTFFDCCSWLWLAFQPYFLHTLFVWLWLPFCKLRQVYTCETLTTVPARGPVVIRAAIRIPRELIIKEPSGRFKGGTIVGGSYLPAKSK